ncbi:nuclear transport factor 2 family protein [Actinomycetospora chiangmaiensis]|uniref:nuclear transport factor 2 family protein n=1 Tax=Actinomycetospora chiangmaiensis TaxID=402650 RepID=UPI000A03C676|nr:nuclear transport factor 2 family protein [Actinomycetospora chiangmaiensis]
MSDAADSDNLLAAERALHAAQLASDVPTLDRLIDDDVLYVGPDGSIATKHDDLEAIRSGRQVLTRLEERDLRARTIGSTGLTWSLLGIEGSVNGQPVAATVRYTRAWAHEKNAGWRVVAAHATVRFRDRSDQGRWSRRFPARSRRRAAAAGSEQVDA